MRYCGEVYRNVATIKKALLSYTKELILQLIPLHQKSELVGDLVITFYKHFMHLNTRYDLLNSSFRDAMEIRRIWQEMKFWDAYFELEIEEILIQKNF